ncbi:MAG: hypothetical protein ABJN14_07260 [Paracoccaceae bacterium]
MTKVTRVLLGERIIGPEVTFDLAMNSRFRALQDAPTLGRGL